MSLEIHPNEILNFDPVVPGFIWSDFIPTFLINPIRKLFAWPAPSPREKWFILVVLVKQSLEGVVALFAEEEAKAKEQAEKIVKTLKKSELN